LTAGIGSEVLGLLLRFTMSKETAEAVKTRFSDMSARGEPVSYLDCVLFDTALDTLGIEQEYYGMSGEEWQETVKQREKTARKYETVKTIAIPDTPNQDS